MQNYFSISQLDIVTDDSAPVIDSVQILRSDIGKLCAWNLEPGYMGFAMAGNYSTLGFSDCLPGGSVIVNPPGLQ